MVFSFWTFFISIFKKLTHSKVPSFLKKKIHFSALNNQIWLFNVKSGEKIAKGGTEPLILNVRESSKGFLSCTTMKSDSFPATFEHCQAKGTVSFVI